MCTLKGAIIPHTVQLQQSQEERRVSLSLILKASVTRQVEHVYTTAGDNRPDQ